MRRWILYLAVFALCAGFGSGGKDLAKTKPPAVIQILQENHSILIRTDLGDSGKGETLNAAIADMNRKADGEILMDTAEYLLLSEQCRYLLPQIKMILRPSMRICICEGVQDLESLWLFLRQHNPKSTLLMTERSDTIQTLTNKEGEYYLG